MDLLLVLSAAVRAVHYGSALLLFGSLVFLIVVARPAVGRFEAERARLERLIFRLAVAGLAAAVVTALLWLWLLGASMSGRPLGAALDPHLLVLVVTRTKFGGLWLARMATATGLVAFLALERHRAGAFGPGRAPALALALAAFFLATIGYAGHAGDESGAAGAIHLSADMLHVLAAGAWLGALPGLVFLLSQPDGHETRGWLRIAQAATPRFSILGFASVATLVLTGLVNSWFLVGSIPALVGTNYGCILMCKLALLLAMVSFAAINRWRLMPRLVAAEGPRRAKEAALWSLRRNAFIEAALGIGIVALVGALVGTTPAAHQQPDWPFPYRLAPSSPSLAHHGDAVLMLAGCLALVGVACVLLGLISRIWWRSAAGVLVLALSLALVAPQFLVAAYPTSYYRSPVPYDAAAIARGLAVYQGNCAACHGPYGYGDGSAANTRAVKPSDLTETHLFHAGVGTLFWWIGSGSADGAMPPFAQSLGESERWDVIAFLRAQADAEAANGMTAEVEPFRPVQAPGFTFQLPGREPQTLASERGKAIVLMVLYTLPESAPRLAALAAAAPAFARERVEIVALPIEGALPSEAAASSFSAILAEPSPDAVAAYSLFRRVQGPEGVLPLPAHMEFLIDRAGYLRARWLPGQEIGWEGLAALAREIAALDREPKRPPPTAEHAH
ncbi:MAG TPA: copper homeostasis membrane protein CopD [Alphaproteobacteria bacterium]|nr:copper homeostasis membrane protein CopD [Alphaproteobacteria bacterium]